MVFGACLPLNGQVPGCEGCQLVEELRKREGWRQYHHDHGDRATDTGAQKLPPRPLTSRWGAVSNSEKYLRAFTQDELVYVWEEKLVLPGSGGA